MKNTPRSEGEPSHPKKLKFGVVLPSYGLQAGRLAMIDTAHLAEDLNFDSIWLTDHIALPDEDAERFGNIYESITSLSYLAASTSRIRLGISALVLPQRNPVTVAKQIATVDVLSSGRTMLAVGVGWSEGEFTNLGENFHTRGVRMDEAIQVLRLLWQGEQAISFHGKHYQFDRIFFSPRPLQPGGPPLWVGGESRAAIRRAARLADGWHPNAKGAKALEEAMHLLCPSIGERPFAVSLRIRLSFNASPDRVHLFGSPEEIFSQLRAYQAAGMTYAVITFLGETLAERHQAMRRFVHEVVSTLYHP